MKERPVVTAFVLLNVAIDSLPEVAEQLVAIDGVSGVWSVAGRHDLVVQVKVRQNDDLADVVAARIGRVPGIENSETLIAFREYGADAVDIAFVAGSDR